MKKSGFMLKKKNGSALVKKDFRLMLSARFFLLAAGSLLLYSLYIHFVYVKMDEKIFPVYCYDPDILQDTDSVLEQSYGSARGQDELTAPPSAAELPPIIHVSTPEELSEACEDGYSVGIDLSGTVPEIRMVSCGIDAIDNLRAAYAVSGVLPAEAACAVSGVLPAEAACAVSEAFPAEAACAVSEAFPAEAACDSAPAGTEPAGHTVSRSSFPSYPAAIIGRDGREMKCRREITAEFLFFELTAVGFLGLAAMIFKEKAMGVIRVHAVLPVSRHGFLFSKLGLILLSDLLFSALLTLINLGPAEGMAVLPLVLIQAGILSLLMSLTGFLCAVALPDFKQFSLLYLVLAVFITTPVFLAGQMGIEIGWMKYHPMYHLFMAMKRACFHIPTAGFRYYMICAGAVLLLFLLAMRGLRREMEREG